MNLVCRNCGHDTFEQVRVTQTRYTMQHDDRAGWWELSESCEDGGDMGDHEIVCADCGETIEADDLCTPEAFEAEDEVCLTHSFTNPGDGLSSEWCECGVHCNDV